MAEFLSYSLILIILLVIVGVILGLIFIIPITSDIGEDYDSEETEHERTVQAKDKHKVN